jgi:signal transduction histidine kinase
MSKDQYFKRFESLFSSPDSIAAEPVNGKALPIEPEIGPAAGLTEEAPALTALQARLAELETALAQAQADRLQTEQEQLAVQTALTKRTQELTLALQVSISTTTYLNSNELLQNVADLIKTSFDLYHVQFFLFESESQSLKLAAGAGEIGRDLLLDGLTIQLSQEPSLIARAARTRQPVIVNDTSRESDFLPHYALPHTRSELAVALTIGQQLLGVLDVQASNTNRFGEDEISVMSLLASQISVALRNARQYEEAQTALRQPDRPTRPQPETNPQDYRRPSPLPHVGYAYDSNEVKQLAEGETAVNGHGASIQQTLTVRGRHIGRVAVIESEPDEDTSEIVNAVAERLATHVDNLRLLVEAEQARQQSDKRARELEAIGKVSSAASTNLDSKSLLQTVVDQTTTSLDLPFVQIYLLDEAGQQLSLAAATGELGQQLLAKGQAIPFDHEQSLIAQCARTRQGQLINDLAAEPALSAAVPGLNSQAELTVPMIVGHNLVGVFDFHARQAGHFTAEDLQLKTTLAEQVAIALQNARLYAELRATVARLREADQLKSSFLANVSHKLRTPLNSILGFAQVILENIDEHSQPIIYNDVLVIQKNGQHLLGIISDILDMAKINAGKMSLNPEIFDLKVVIEEVAEVVAPLANAKSLTISVDTSTRPTLNIYADRTRIKQVLLNLVNNAIKFTDSGVITLNAQREGAVIHLEVCDTGQGIAPTDLEKVFVEFAQLDTSTTRKVGGTGLGLPISRHLIELHGGKLWAESNGQSGPQGGSKFLIQLPVETTYTL